MIRSLSRATGSPRALTLIIALALVIATPAAAGITDQLAASSSGNCGVTFLLLIVLIVAAVVAIKVDHRIRKNGGRKNR